VANRVTQAPVEALETVTGAKARSTQATVEVLETASGAARTTQAVIEVLTPSVTVYNRTLTDTTSVTESVSRQLTLARDASDTTTGSDNVGKEARFLVDTYPTTDFLSGGIGSGSRTAADSISFSDSAQVVFANNVRTLTDDTTTSDTLTRTVVYNRLLIENLTTSESVTFPDITPVASFSSVIVSGTEPLRVEFVDTSTHNPTSWLWDFGDGNTSTEQNPYHIYAAGTYDVTLTVTNDAGTDSVTLTAYITASPLPTGTGGGGGGSFQTSPPVVVQIKVDGIDITDDIRYSDASFSAMVNGGIAPCQFSVRDLPHTQSFTTGSVIDVYFDSQLYWTGFVEKIHRQYSFEVDDTTDPQTVSRWFLIEGYELNVLLSKRVVWNIANPTKVLTPPGAYADPTDTDNWIADVPSDVIVRYVLENYTVLPDDGVTFNEVLNIGSPNADVPGAYAGGTRALDFLGLINSTLNGIFYLRPNRSFVFRDVEVATTPFVITDTPNSSYDVGPRQYSFTSDSSKMINDALIWGASAGSGQLVFAREESAASETEHNRWQYGEWNFTMYRQATVDHRADAIVNGNTPTRHGAKEDRILVEAIVFRPVFQLGDVVRCEQHVFDGTQTAPFNTNENFVAINLPIRTMEITFPTGRNPRFRMQLSQEIDEPWTIAEFRWPRIPLPPPIPPFPPPPIVDQGRNHAYFGTATFAVTRAHGGGGGDAGPYDATLNYNLLFSDNQVPYHIIPGTTYVGAMGIIAGAEGPNNYADYAPALGFTNRSEGVLIRPVTVLATGDLGVFGWGGTFTYYSGAPATDVYAAGSVAMGGGKPFTAGVTSDHTMNLTWWLDVFGEPPPITPGPGTVIENDWQIALVAGTVFYTTYPYAPGTLTVYLETIDSTGGSVLTPVAITETDPSTGQFTTTTTIPVGSKLIAYYTIAGSASFFGPVAEQATRIDSTHYTVRFGVQSDTEQVWVDGYRKRVGTDYSMSGSTVTFTSAVAVGSWVWVAYIANGAAT